MTLGVAIFWLVLGLVLLTWGGEWLVRGSSRIAEAMGIPPLIVGLTVVAFGTSAPELAVTLVASAQGETDLAVGNVVGSNLFNTFFILGLSALIVPLTIERRLIRFDVPLMIALSIATLAMAWDGEINRYEGLSLLAVLTLYLILLIRASRSTAPAEIPSNELEPASPLAANYSWVSIVLAAVFLLAGLALLLVGSNCIVSGAVAIARQAGLSELLIGVTIIAAGTSLPEVAASIIAAVRGQRDLAVGNVVGSNIFNLACVLAACASVAHLPIPVLPRALHVDLPFLLASALICWPIVASRGTIGRLEGLLLFTCYLVYLTLQVLDAIGHPTSESVTMSVVRFGLPILVIGVSSLAIGRNRLHRRSRQQSMPATQSS